MSERASIPWLEVLESSRLGRFTVAELEVEADRGIKHLRNLQKRQGVRRGKCGIRAHDLFRIQATIEELAHRLRSVRDAIDDRPF